MVFSFHRVMTRKDWIDQLADFSLACLGSTPEQQGDRLQEFNDLLIMAPEIALIDGVRPMTPDACDLLIGAGAFETAALSLLDGTAYIISCGRGGHMVTVMLPGSGEERSVMGDTLALAMLSALAQALFEAAHDDALSYFVEPEERPRHLH